MINKENYELWLLRLAEGELSPAEEAEVCSWLAQHPAEAEELRLYMEAPRLTATSAAGCSESASQPPRVRQLWQAAGHWAAAAAVVLVLMVPVAAKMGRMEPMPLQLAENEPIVIKEEPVQPAPAPQQERVPQQAAPRVETLAMATESKAEADEPTAEEYYDDYYDYVYPWEDDPYADVPLFVYADMPIEEPVADEVEDDTTAPEAAKRGHIEKYLERLLPDSARLDEATRWAEKVVPQGMRYLSGLIALGE